MLLTWFAASFTQIIFPSEPLTSNLNWNIPCLDHRPKVPVFAIVADLKKKKREKRKLGKDEKKNGAAKRDSRSAGRGVMVGERRREGNETGRIVVFVGRRLAREV